MWTDLDRPPLDAAALRSALVEPAGGWAALDVVTSTGSTNADLLDAARAGAADRTVLIAEEQVSGRGRHARQWTSPPRAGVNLSVLLRTRGVPLDQLGWLPLLTGVAVAEAVQQIAEVPVTLKWPNDVLVHGRKLGGILAELAATGPDPVVVVGLGLNVSLRAEELPVPTATSLALEQSACTDRDPVVRAVLRELARQERAWRGKAGDPVLSGLAQAYRARCSTLGQEVLVHLPHGEELAGEAVDVDATGRLVVRDATGRTHALSAGDVTHVRSAQR
ncbi:biotin--[acetyl-CoA-carboxylase] ligase [Rhodococcus sp. X156]|uniref:biotin--[acetyl-CoA-carboxylase] ligase n=1 Tax=Rhodococcus sp. X156 TaxID=2499145 RepID=UPI000FDABFFA|nr:biotin--[acetyl-CoA-carboxylase] ligase [Rhodococcus sp. X156]